jgi:hypothetical protein
MLRVEETSELKEASSGNKEEEGNSELMYKAN